MLELGPGQTFGDTIPGMAIGVSLSRHKPSENVPRHAHSQAYVCLVITGGFEENSGGQAAWREAGELIFHPAGEPHSDRFGATGAVCLNLQLEADVSIPVAHRANPRLGGAATELASELALGAEADPLCATGLLAEVNARLFAPHKSTTDPKGVAQALRALDEEPQRDWLLKDLARLAERHPNHLARAFRDQVGISIGAYRRRKRLISLCIDLRFSKTALAELAAAHGYADQAHMCREFRRLAGMSPGAWRRIHANSVQDRPVGAR